MDTSSKDYAMNGNWPCPDCGVNLLNNNHLPGCSRLPEKAAGGEKLSNPKDIIGSDKVPLDLVPGTTKAYLAIGHLEGMLKYGLVNWREAGVRASIYLAALERHVEKWKNGEWADPETQVPHLANAIACLSILIDAIECGKLTDDRPKQAPVGDVIARMSDNVKHLKKIYGHHNPKHYTYDPGPQPPDADLYDGSAKEREVYNSQEPLQEVVRTDSSEGRYPASTTRPEVYKRGGTLREGDKRRDDSKPIFIGASDRNMRRDELQSSDPRFSQVTEVANSILRGSNGRGDVQVQSTSNRSTGLGSGNPSDVGSKRTTRS